MRQGLVLALLAAVLLLPASDAFAQAPPLRGINLALTLSDPGFEYDPFLKEIRSTGANAVNLLMPWYVDDHRAVEIRRIPPFTPSDLRVRATIQAAHREGLHVMLLPIVLIADPETSEWRGSLAPADLDAWYASYGRRLLALAEIAESERVAVLSVGSELSSLETNTGHWRDLIEQVRQRYSGSLAYSANWDSVSGPEFWGDLDYFAISCYYELAGEDAPEAEAVELAQEAAAWKDWLLEAKEQLAPELPLILSEVGFPSIDGGAITPWDYTRPGPVDWEEQRRGYEAFLRAWDGEPELHGAFFYTWIEYNGTPQRGYSPRGKPAEELIRAWYGGTP